MENANKTFIHQLNWTNELICIYVLLCHCYTIRFGVMPNVYTHLFYFFSFIFMWNSHIIIVSSLGCIKCMVYGLRGWKGKTVAPIMYTIFKNIHLFYIFHKTGYNLPLYYMLLFSIHSFPSSQARPAHSSPDCIHYFMAATRVDA